MKRTWPMGLLVGFVAGAAVFTADTALHAGSRGGSSAGNVACLDVVKIFNEYERQKDLTEEMRAARDEMKNEAERRAGQIDSLQATIDAMNPNDPMRVKKLRELFRLKLDYKNWGELMQAEMTREVGVWTRKMYREVLDTTGELAQREGYDLVFYRDAPDLVGFDPEAVQEQIRSRKLVYSSPTVDITQVILDKLNANYRAQPKRQMLQVWPTGP
ncbi:MAG: OmpH family outer membrane protein [Phycisphaerae bacterium]